MRGIALVVSRKTKTAGEGQTPPAALRYRLRIARRKNSRYFTTSSTFTLTVTSRTNLDGFLIRELGQVWRRLQTLPFGHVFVSRPSWRYRPVVAFDGLRRDPPGRNRSLTVRLLTSGGMTRATLRLDEPTHYESATGQSLTYQVRFRAGKTPNPAYPGALGGERRKAECIDIMSAFRDQQLSVVIMWITIARARK